MQKKLWTSALALLLVGGTVTAAMAEPFSSTPATAQVLVQEASRSQPPLDTRVVSLHLLELAELADFSDWRGAELSWVRTLHRPTGERAAVLWEVRQEGQVVGSLVSSTDGTHVYEFTRRPAPVLPPELRARAHPDGHIYSGPMMHLVYLQGAEGLELYNLLTGEFLPSGELRSALPDSVPASDATYATKPSGNAAVERRVADGSGTLDGGALLAAGHSGQPDNKQNVQPLHAFLTELADVDASWRIPSYVTYDAIPDKLFVTCQLAAVADTGRHLFAALRDPFAPVAPLVYIDSRLGVSAVRVSSPSAQ